MEKIEVCCSFCGRTASQVTNIITGSDANICNVCIDMCYNLLNPDADKPKIPKPIVAKSTEITPEAIYAHLNQYVVGQEYAKKVLSVLVANHYKRINNPIIDGTEIEKSNALMIGPSGSGKTLLATTVAKFLDLPCVIVDATSLTEAGYVGEDVESILTKLLQQANGDVKKAENGIIFVDECFTGEVEVFTDKGFIRFDQLSKTEKVLQYNTDGTTEFVTPDRYVEKNFTGDLLKVYNDSFVHISTPNHNRVVFSDKLEKIQAVSSLNPEYKVLVSAEIDCDSIPSLQQRKEFFDTKTTITSHFYNDAIYLKTMAQLTGLNVDIHYVGTHYELILTDKFVTQSNIKTEHIPYDGKVYCVTVPSGMIMVRIDGHIQITGNCDKKAKKQSSSSNGRDVSGEGVQQALLKMIEGAEINVPTTPSKKSADYVKMNTKNILFIVGGAFVGIHDVIAKKLNKDKSTGFFGTEAVNIKTLSDETIVKNIDHETLEQFGLIPELLGRLPVIVPLNKLTVSQLKSILIEPKNAIIKQFQAMFKLSGVELKIDDSALELLASNAIKNNTGARSLRGALEKMLFDVQFNLNTHKLNGVTTVTIVAEKENFNIITE